MSETPKGEITKLERRSGQERRETETELESKVKLERRGGPDRRQAGEVERPSPVKILEQVPSEVAGFLEPQKKAEFSAEQLARLKKFRVEREAVEKVSRINIDELLRLKEKAEEKGLWLAREKLLQDIIWKVDQEQKEKIKLKEKEYGFTNEELEEAIEQGLLD